MAQLTWNDTPMACTALLDDVPVCTLKIKDIGGVAASWQDDHLWPPPAHMPKAPAQPTRFFADLAEAKAAVEKTLAG
ncbi:MAG: hypothetical protein A3E00_03770 [Curvibacter sp. RIFCSPHIGHO2_12_FULL_63_18]|uniref:hypothetical protein n=1 Tax=Rhodoferax sp. TaxID=50421 RepID=UPI0008AAA180|nr:hypothetical protein [Rhodoferax sp.]OGO95724.1 MAG: hypothetical protein A2037_16850 [Curvibacter sp. GWA2_63_95]OGO99973.1 MAG: hypothetical protein A3E00_03770 [Curvibacter sp. RIFCSPHIGHO2_12_FULL_63_18]HCX81940.1 hypothetical protein [Rhodoferax sp.]